MRRRPPDLRPPAQSTPKQTKRWTLDPSSEYSEANKEMAHVRLMCGKTGGQEYKRGAKGGGGGGEERRVEEGEGGEEREGKKRGGRQRRQAGGGGGRMRKRKCHEI